MSIDQPTEAVNPAPTGKTLILVHGRGWKPEPAALESLWRRAMAGGLDRDFADAGGRLVETPPM